MLTYLRTLVWNIIHEKLRATKNKDKPTDTTIIINSDRLDSLSTIHFLICE